MRSIEITDDFFFKPGVTIFLLRCSSNYSVCVCNINPVIMLIKKFICIAVLKTSAVTVLKLRQ